MVKVGDIYKYTGQHSCFYAYVANINEEKKYFNCHSFKDKEELKRKMGDTDYRNNVEHDIDTGNGESNIDLSTRYDYLSLEPIDATPKEEYNDIWII